MSWAKLDDRFDSHPKVLAAWSASPASIGLWALGLTYAARHETDGFLPSVAVRVLTAPIDESDGLDAISALVDAGLWDAVDGGWQIHDFTEYNPSAADSRARREKRAEAGRKGGRASGRSRRRASG